MRPPLATLDSLPPADQAALRRKLIRVAADSRQAGWLAWELGDPVYSVARGFGVALTAAQIASVLAA